MDSTDPTSPRSWFQPHGHRRGLGRPKLLSDSQHIPAAMPEGAWLPLIPLSTVRTGSGCDGVTADNETTHELGDKQKASKGTGIQSPARG